MKTAKTKRATRSATSTNCGARSARLIADRAVALVAVAMKAMNAPASMRSAFARNYKPSGKLSPMEKKFLAAKKPNERARIELGWRVEALQVLLWSVGFVDKLGKPDALVNPRAQLDAVLVHASDVSLRAAARRRSDEELLALSDAMYRAHWRVRDASLNGKPEPKGLHPGVVRERDHAIRWILAQEKQPWDDVTCDT